MSGVVVTCACAEIARAQRAPLARSKRENLLFSIIEGNLQRFQKSQILRRHLELWRLLLFGQDFLVDLNVQRLEKSPVCWGDFRVLAVASREADGRVELQNDFKAGR